MESYELNITAPPRRSDGKFPKGHRPFNICSGKSITVNGRSYSRRKAGGFRWFYADEVEKYLKLVQ